MSQKLVQFVVGAILGLIAGIVGVELGPIGMLIAIGLVSAIGARMSSLVGVGGALLAIGALWLVLDATSAASCTGTSDFCGNANFLPFAGVSLILLMSGVVATGLALRRTRPTP